MYPSSCVDTHVLVGKSICLFTKVDVSKVLKMISFDFTWFILIVVNLLYIYLSFLNYTEIEIAEG